MSHSFLVLQALLHSDETTGAAAVSLINKRACVCVCCAALTAAAAGAEQIVLGSWVSVLQSKRGASGEKKGSGPKCLAFAWGLSPCLGPDKGQLTPGSSFLQKQ